MSKWTPGPWVYGNWLNRAEGVHDGAGWVDVWSQSDPDNCLPIIACKHQDELANARLISAAPEILQALEAMLEVHGVTQEYADKHIEIPQSWVEVSNVARAAIAKAGGAA